MKHAIALVLTVALCGVALGAGAATEQLSVTGYNVVTKLAEKVPLPNGGTIMVGGEGHSSIVNDKTGEQTSQWCNSDAWPDEKGAPTAFVGHCSIFYDNGDVLWISVTGTTNDKPLTWTVIGGTGKYAGATGGGTSKVVSQRGDVYAETYKATGTLTTK